MGAVEGGVHPTPAQEVSAYKKALRSFHPDRIQSKGLNIRHQIEAEVCAQPAGPHCYTVPPDFSLS